jgi:lysophospholipase L1-like esterase
MNEANAMIRDFSDKDRRLFYFNSAAPLLGSDGKPDDALFLKDQLHLNDKGYEAWTKLIRSVVKQAFEQAMKGQ